MTKADTIATLIETSGSRLVSVKFQKRNGDERTLVFNPCDFGEIKGTGTPRNSPDLFTVRETTKGQWRSFDANRVMSIKVNGTVTNF